MEKRKTMKILRQWPLHKVQLPMHQALSSVIWLIIANLFTWLVLTCSVQAQTVTPTPSPLSPRDLLIQAIQQRAQRDVEMGKPLESTGGLQVLFGEEAKAVSMPMREVVETYETAYQAAKSAQSPLDNLRDLLRPDIAVWIVAAILAVVVMVRNLITDYLNRFLKWLGEAVYLLVAVFWGVALRRYRKALERQYQEVKLIFPPDRPLQMQDVYVPLHVAGSGSRKMVDAYQAIQQHRWLMVIGAPGSGKTMLMTHLALTYARQGLRDFADQPIPVLLQLNRFNESTASLVELLENVLERHDFPNAERFITASLKHGRLLLLFDGLDEVNSDMRGKVEGHIRDLLQQYPDNRAIVTCRTQVYNDELGDWANQTLAISEFSDQQIQRFLSAWEPDMPEEKSIEHFFRTLRERPQIMALARNPLLLTMIVYLYTDTEFALPHSRAEFYKRSTNLLLEQWKIERNRYKVSHKRLVLQHLALFNQERAKQAGSDRRTIALPVVLEQICEILPSLTLDEKDALPMLDEIVERSGLLLPVDGGTGYQFIHLTLQEFFAARALEAEPDRLLAFFAEAPDAWREVVWLWCGLKRDSTDLIRQLSQVDPVMAFECLGDARQVETSYVAELVNTFQGRLAEAADDEHLARAFALVAAGPHHRGEALFDFLENNLTVPSRRLAAATALALTNLPKAADALAECAAHEPVIRPYLIRMGDLTVPALEAWACQQQTWAMDALREVGTPQAALALVPLLWWDDETTVPYQAAWRLAALLHRPNVEMALRTFDLTSDQRNATQIEWIWSPFDEPPISALPVIAGRIAHLLHTTPSEKIPADPSSSFDPRLVIPLCAVAARDGQLEKIETDVRGKLIGEADQVLFSLSPESPNQATSGQTVHNVFIAKYVDQISTHPVWRHLFNSLSTMGQFNLLRCLLLNKPIPNADDWRNVLHPSSYIFKTSWEALGVKLLLALLALLNLWSFVGDILRQGSHYWGWEDNLALLAGIGIIISIVLLSVGRIKIDALTNLLRVAAWGLGTSLGIIVGGDVGNSFNNYEFSIRLSIVLFGLFGLFGSILFRSVERPLRSGVGFSLLGIVLGLVSIESMWYEDEAVLYVAGGVAIGTIVVRIFRLGDGFGTSVFIAFLSGLFIGVVAIIEGLLFYLPSMLLDDMWNWPGVVLFWVAYLAILGFLVWDANRQQRRAQNPLHGLLDKQDIAVARPYWHAPLAHWLRWRRL